MATEMNAVTAGFLSVSFVAVPQIAVAQELVPLRETLAESALTYGTVRCAGLYTALLEWMGEATVGVDAAQQTKNNIEFLLLSSVLIAQEVTSSDSIDQIVDYTMRDARNVADLYLLRFERNYAAVGQAWGDDSLTNDDLQVCKQITEGLQTAELE